MYNAFICILGAVDGAGVKIHRACARKFRTSGQILFDVSSYCRTSVHRNSPLLRSACDRILACERYCPIRRRAGAATGLLKSLVDHTIPINRSTTSSANVGQVLAASFIGPF